MPEDSSCETRGRFAGRNITRRLQVRASGSSIPYTPLLRSALSRRHVPHPEPSGAGGIEAPGRKFPFSISTSIQQKNVRCALPDHSFHPHEKDPTPRCRAGGRRVHSAASGGWRAARGRPPRPATRPPGSRRLALTDRLGLALTDRLGLTLTDGLGLTHCLTGRLGLTDCLGFAHRQPAARRAARTAPWWPAPRRAAPSSRAAPQRQPRGESDGQPHGFLTACSRSHSSPSLPAPA